MSEDSMFKSEEEKLAKEVANAYEVVLWDLELGILCAKQMGEIEREKDLKAIHTALLAVHKFINGPAPALQPNPAKPDTDLKN